MAVSGAGEVIEITRLTKIGGPLTKRISLSPDGTLVSDGSACLMARGNAQRVRLDNLSQFGELIWGMESNQAIALGRMRSDLPDQVRVITKDRLATLNGTTPPDTIARIGVYISYAGGQPALALIDIDTKGMPPEVRARIKKTGGFWAALVSVLPKLATTGRIVRQSTSTGISRTDTGDALPGSNGMHIYLHVQDGGDVERFLKTLHERAWLAGFGWHMVGVAGQLLDRSIVDRMVYAPERLVFEGAPVLAPPLAQNQEARRPTVFDHPPLDTKAVCPQLGPVETQRLNDLAAKSARALEPDIAKARETFVNQHAEHLAKRASISVLEARRIVEWQCKGVLLPDVALAWDDARLAGCTVADILKDPDRFVGATMADPIEGPGYGRCKAKVMRRADGTPWINSFAHGRAVYELRYDAPPNDDPPQPEQPEEEEPPAPAIPLEAKTEAASLPTDGQNPDSTDLRATVARLASLDVIDYIQQRDLEAKNLGIDVADLNAMVKEARRTQKSQQAEAERRAKVEQSEQAQKALPKLQAAAVARLVRLDDAAYQQQLHIEAKRLGIPATSLSKIVRAERKAATQRSTAKAVDAVVVEFNKHYAVVLEGGKAVVYFTTYDPDLKREKITTITFDDLRKLYLNRTIVTGQDGRGQPIIQTVADVWLKSEDRCQYINGVVFDPSGKKQDGVLNLWKGFAVDAVKGDWSIMKDHIQNHICGNDTLYFNWFMGWLARLIQFPGEQAEVAIVLRGIEGTGKGTIARAIIRIFGRHGQQISNSRHLVGNFNLHLRDLVFLFPDEAFFAGDRANVGALNALITEPTLTIEGKGVNIGDPAPNRLHIMMASNETWVVPASAEARRYFVLDVLDAVVGNRTLFRRTQRANEKWRRRGHAL
jgi:Family of unknown function (DUF5906)